MNKSKVFSIIVLNYNNYNYLFEMIDSVYNQSYEYIELIVIDDASSYFDREKLLKYIDKKNKQVKIKIIVNKKNIGTVKTINKALKKVTGEYCLITASDDALANGEVVSNFVKYFDITNSTVVTSQWIICDNKLNRIKGYIPKNSFKKYNRNQAKLLFDMCKSNRFGSGATAYKKVLFNKYKFDEKYKYLEDWPFWLKLLFNNEKIYFASFDGLLHRSGGISESKTIKDSTKQFYKELLDTVHKEIIPNFKKLTGYQKWSILDSYKYNIEYYSKYFDTSKYERELYKLVFNNRRIKLFYILNELKPHLIYKLMFMFKHNKPLIITIFSTIIISLIFTKYIDNNNLKLLFIIITYIIMYVGFNILKEVRSMKKWKSIQ